MLRTVPSTSDCYNKYLLNERMNQIIQLLSYWMASSTFNEDGESERKGSTRKELMNSVWGPLESEVPMSHPNHVSVQRRRRGQELMLA